MTFELWFMHILLSCYSSQGLKALKAVEGDLRREYERAMAEPERPFEDRSA